MEAAAPTPTPATAPCVMCGEPVTLDAETMGHVEAMIAKARQDPELTPHLADMLPMVLCTEHANKRRPYTAAMRDYARTGQPTVMFYEAVANTGYVLETHEAHGHKTGANRNRLILTGTSGAMAEAYVKALARGRRDGAAWVQDAYKPAANMSATSQRWEQQPNPPATAFVNPPPRWMGADTLQAAWRGCSAAYAMEVQAGQRGGLTVVASQCLQPLCDAHPIVVEPDQVRALLGTLSMNDAASLQYGQQLRLPFPAVWLSLVGKQQLHVPSVVFEGVADDTWDRDHGYPQAGFNAIGGLPGSDTASVAFPAALLYDTSYYTDAGSDEGCIAVLPFAPSSTDPAVNAANVEHIARRPTMLGPVGAVLFCDEDGPRAERMQGHGLLPFMTMSPKVWAQVDMPPGGGVIPAVTNIDGRNGDTAYDNQEWMTGGIAWLLARVALEVMALMDSANVTVAQAALERREIKRATKRGWKIASEVVIRRRLRPGGRQAGTSDRTYTHQWEVEGHSNHVRRGVHVRCPTCLGEGSFEGHWFGDYLVPEAHEARDGVAATVFERRPCQPCAGTGLDPKKVRPCFRTDERGQRTCPDGCRKEWVPPYVAGPEGAPLVQKTRRLPGQPDS